MRKIYRSLLRDRIANGRVIKCSVLDAIGQNRKGDMHEHLELVMPPQVADINEAVSSVMRPFEEGGDDQYTGAFYDWFVLGGRFAGNKLIQSLGDERVEEFRQWLIDEEITVSSIQFGKQEIRPESQIPRIDAKWNQMFPSKDGAIVACPLFKHANDQYGKGTDGMIDGDVSRLDESCSVKCERVIFAAQAWQSESRSWTGGMEAQFMLCSAVFNGKNVMPIKWDGTIGHALSQFNESLKNKTDEARQAITPQGDWICVTVDYHS